MPNSKSRSKNENETDRSSETENERAEAESVDRPEVSGEPEKKFLRTLPPEFKRLHDARIGIDGDRPQDLIESLGNVLGIDDYRTNRASFWFLDTLALQVMRHRKHLDDYYLSVLISWLAGEMVLIRDKKHPREEFLKEMKEIFNTAANEVSEKKRIPYWDEIVSNDDAEGARVETEDQSVGDQRSLILKESKQQEPTKNSQKKRSKELQSNVKLEVNKKETLPVVKDASSPVLEETDKSFSNVDPLLALDVVIESTYDMYANEFRYALVYAVFVEPVEVQTYHLPFVLRTPRPVKLRELKTAPFNLQLQKRFEEDETKSKKREKKATGKGKKKAQMEVPATPPPSLKDEESLTLKRQSILPLIEANNALEIFKAQEDDAEQ